MSNMNEHQAIKNSAPLPMPQVAGYDSDNESTDLSGAFGTGFKIMQDTSGLNRAASFEQLTSLPGETPTQNVRELLEEKDDDDDDLRPMSTYNPFENQMESEETTGLIDAIRAFYFKYNKAKLRDGVGEYVIFAEQFGVNALNRRLMKQYGADLNGNVEDEVIFKKEAERLNELKKSKHGEMLKFKGALKKFLTKYDKKNIVKQNSLLLRYAHEKGPEHVNKYLLEKYGIGLSEYSHEVPKQPKKKDDDLEVEKKTLAKYYAKHNPEFLRDKRNLKAVVKWAKFHGVDALDEKLYLRYGEGYFEFRLRMLALREDLIRFHNRMMSLGENTLEDVEAILDWGILHGRQAINYELYRRYEQHLDSDRVEEIHSNEQRHQAQSDPNRVSF